MNKSDFPGLPPPSAGGIDGPVVKRSKKQKNRAAPIVEENPFRLEAQQKHKNRNKKKYVNPEPSKPPTKDFFEHEFPGLAPEVKPTKERKGFILGDPNKKDELEERYGIVINKKGKKKNKYGRR